MFLCHFIRGCQPPENQLQVIKYVSLTSLRPSFLFLCTTVLHNGRLSFKQVKTEKCWLSTEQVYTLANTDKQLLSHVKSCRLRLFSHVIMQPQNSTENSAMTGW